MFFKKIGKKIIFAIRRKKAFFLDFYSQALLSYMVGVILVVRLFDFSLFRNICLKLW